MSSRNWCDRGYEWWRGRCSCMPVDAVIVGAGIAGLSAAHELTRSGVACVVLERAPRAGGGGVGGGDGLGRTNPRRRVYMQREGGLHAVPAAWVLGIPPRPGPFVASRLFSWAGKMRMGAELFIPAQRKDDDTDESIGGF